MPAEKIGEYFAGLEKSGISLNFGTYYGATQARVAVIGQDARDPTPEELAEDEGPGGNRHERRRPGHLDSPHLSARQLFENRTTDRIGKGRRAVTAAFMSAIFAEKERN